MRAFAIICLFIISSTSFAGPNVESAYFERPLSCPLRFSRLSGLRDQMQSLAATLGKGCTQASQQALTQASTSIANLEGIASSWQTYNGTDQTAVNTQLAKNLNQILGSLNMITSNNSCFYDMRSRGALPVLGDVITSLSQFGLLIPSAPGMLVASAGYVAGSALKIIHELVKKKFNWNKPEERRLFLQLNCAFFDNRRVMEEMGVFNPETSDYSEELEAALRKERLQVLREQKAEEKNILAIEKKLNSSIALIPTVSSSGLNPALAKNLEDLALAMSSKPGDYSSKWQQVTALSLVAESTLQMLKELKLEKQEAPLVTILTSNLEAILPELAPKAKVWTSTIDEYEILYRGPLVAFFTPIAKAIRKGINLEEASMAESDPKALKAINELRIQSRNANTNSWALNQRLISLESRINSLELNRGNGLFSSLDEGKSDTVEILEYYKRLQTSILGREGKGYIKKSLKNSKSMKTALINQINDYDSTSGSSKREHCAAAEKLRFAWAQYRAKVQESYDFVSTNLDLYRSSFKTGKEKMKRARRYVIAQIDSVEISNTNGKPEQESIGDYVLDVKRNVSGVEKRLRNSACF